MMTNSEKRLINVLLIHMMKLYSGALFPLHGYGSSFSCVHNSLSEKTVETLNKKRLGTELEL